MIRVPPRFLYAREIGNRKPVRSEGVVSRNAGRRPVHNEITVGTRAGLKAGPFPLPFSYLSLTVPHRYVCRCTHRTLGCTGVYTCRRWHAVED